MREPNIIHLTNKWIASLAEVQKQDGTRWVPARARGYPSFRFRVRAAWLVLTGKADALIWPGGQ